jgi:hypothetical protein
MRKYLIILLFNIIIINLFGQKSKEISILAESRFTNFYFTGNEKYQDYTTELTVGFRLNFSKRTSFELAYGQIRFTIDSPNLYEKNAFQKNLHFRLRNFISQDRNGINFSLNAIPGIRKGIKDDLSFYLGYDVAYRVKSEIVSVNLGLSWNFLLAELDIFGNHNLSFFLSIDL